MNPTDPSRDRRPGLAPTLALRQAVLHGLLPASYVAAVLDADTETARRVLDEAANVAIGDA